MLTAREVQRTELGSQHFSPSRVFRGLGWLKQSPLGKFSGRKPRVGLLGRHVGWTWLKRQSFLRSLKATVPSLQCFQLASSGSRRKSTIPEFLDFIPVGRPCYCGEGRFEFLFVQSIRQVRLIEVECLPTCYSDNWDNVAP